MSDTTDNDHALLPFDEEQASETIRRVWHEERWFFSVIDVVGLLTESTYPNRYWSDMKQRIQDEGFREVYANCRQLKMLAPDGKLRETDCADFSTIASLLFSLPAWQRRHGRPLRELDTLVSHGDGNSGIYAITNALTQERYIGSSNNMAARINQHKALLRQGKHHAKSLQEAWMSLGEEAFRFEVLEELSDTKLLEVVEQRYLDAEQPTYNNAHTAQNNSTLPQMSTERLRRVLCILYEMSGFGTTSPIFALFATLFSWARAPMPKFLLDTGCGATWRDHVRGVEGVYPGGRGDDSVSDNNENDAERQLIPSVMKPHDDTPPIRHVWHAGKWYLSVVDAIRVFTNTRQPRTYWSTLKRRLTRKEGFEDLRTRILRLKMEAPDGKQRLTDAADAETLFRIIQSIPSPKAEPFKQWLAKVARERLDEMENPELAADRMRQQYRALGYDDEWIDRRLQGIVIRDELTHEWHERGAKEGKEFASLTNTLHTGTFDVSASEHHSVKHIGQRQNLRDSMTTMELLLMALTEETAKELHQTRDSQGYGELHRDAGEAGEVGGATRRDIEARTGRPVVSGENY